MTIKKLASHNASVIQTAFFAATAILAATNTAFCQSPATDFDQVFNIPPESILPPLSDNTQINLFDGGVLPPNAGSDFLLASPGGVPENLELNLFGGSIGVGFSMLLAVEGTAINVLGGQIASVQTSGAIKIAGGEVDTVFASGVSIVTGGSLVNSAFFSDLALSGGTHDAFISAGGPNVLISGGELNGPLATVAQNVVLSGGRISGGVEFAGPGTVEIVGTDFMLDGLPVDGLEQGESVVVDTRDVPLTGVLSDGSAFAFQLNTTFISSEDEFFDPAGTILLTLVPEPASTFYAVTVICIGGARIRRRP